MSKVGGLLSTLRFIGNLITSFVGEPSLRYELTNDIFQNLNQNENSSIPTTNNTNRFDVNSKQNEDEPDIDKYNTIN